MTDRFGPEVDSLLIKLIPELTEGALNAIYENSDWNHIKTEDMIAYLKAFIKTTTCHANLNVGTLLRRGEFKVVKMMIKAGFCYTKRQINICFEHSGLYDEIKIEKDAYPDACDEYDLVKMKIMEKLIELGIPKPVLYMCSNFYNCFTAAMLMEYDPDMFTYMSKIDKSFYKCLDNMLDMDDYCDLKVHLKIARLSGAKSYMNTCHREAFSDMYKTNNIKKELFNTEFKDFLSTQTYDRAYDMHCRPEFKDSEDYGLLDQALDDITTIYNARSNVYYVSTPEQFFMAIDRLYENGFEHLDEYKYIRRHRNLSLEERKKYIENPSEFYEHHDRATNW